jgi:hypothetical protein
VLIVSAKAKILASSPRSPFWPSGTDSYASPNQSAMMLSTLDVGRRRGEGESAHGFRAFLWGTRPDPPPDEFDL